MWGTLNFRNTDETVRRGGVKLSNSHYAVTGVIPSRKLGASWKVIGLLGVTSLSNIARQVGTWLFNHSQQPHRDASRLSLARERSRHAIEGAVAWQYPGQGQHREQALRMAAAGLYVTLSPQGPGSAGR